MNAVPAIAASARPPRHGVLLSHPHGNVFVRDAASALGEAGLLRRYWTCVAWNEDAPFARMVPAVYRRQLERRSLPRELRGRVRLHPWREMARLAATQAGFPALTRGRFSPNACHESLDRRVARELAGPEGRDVHTVYAYDHAALATFAVAARNGQRRVYDLPIGYWRELEPTILEERERWPEWRATTEAPEFPRAVYERKDAEIELAERIVVPSRFVAGTLARHFPGLRDVIVVPFGAPPPLAPVESLVHRPRPAPLRVLYVGALDLRKGVPYLFEALAALRGRVEVTVVGRASGACRPLVEGLRHVRYFETLPRGEVLALMAASDVFVFPTLFEGMALVVLEAMARGCAVITTANSGYEGIIEHGANGFLVPVRSSAALVATVDRLDADRELLARVRTGGLAATAALSTDAYRRRIVAVCRALAESP